MNDTTKIMLIATLITEAFAIAIFIVPAIFAALAGVWSVSAVSIGGFALSQIPIILIWKK